MLKQLQQTAARKSSLEAKLAELQNQRQRMVSEAAAHRVSYRREQWDVDSLESRSPAYYFFRVVGKLDEKLDRERQEAHAAKVKLDAAERELARIEGDIAAIKDQISEACAAETQYRQELEKKCTELKASGTHAAVQILNMEERISALEIQKHEIKEAISAGRNASSTADRVLSKLKSAEGWNNWDMIGGGGIVTHMAKHSHLDDAQDMICDLHSALRRFKTELTDIRITASVQVNVEGFLRFADYCFDGLIADWTVGSKISQSISSVRNTKSQITKALGKLKELDQAADQEIERLRQKLDDLIVNA